MDVRPLFRRFDRKAIWNHPRRHQRSQQRHSDGQPVLPHARGGGHSPPEKPFGISLSKLNAEHETVWERVDLNFEGTHFVDEKHAYCFDKSNFFVLELATGKTIKRIRIRGVGKVIAFDQSSGKYRSPANVAAGKSRHLLTHRTNIGVGRYHFFMGGQPGFLGRIDMKTADVRYLQVPVQVDVENGTKRFS